MDINTWGATLKNYRISHNLTQTELGAMVGVSQVSIANYEQGKRFPKRDAMLDFARIFDVSLDILLRAPDSPVMAPSAQGESKFSADKLLSILLEEPIEVALAYTTSWKLGENLDLAAFFETVIVPAMVMTGTRWFQDDILVSEEHIISDKVRELIFFHSNRERERYPAKPDGAGRWMGLCAPGEKHELALLMQSNLLSLAGWQTIYLGTQVPFQDLSRAIKKYEPDVVGISVTMDDAIAGLELYVRQIEKTFGKKPAIMIGGQAVRRIDRSLFPSVHAGAHTLAEGALLAERLLASER